jgi:magnesium chelatase family protein
MYTKTYSATLRGIDASIIAVETDVNKGLPGFNIVGLPDKSISEAKERINVAMRASGYEIPPSRVLINLSPAQIRKEGVQFDLAIAISLMINLGYLNVAPDFLDRCCFLGELSLRGEIKGIAGMLAFSIEAYKANFDYLIIPSKNIQEASLVTLVEQSKTEIYAVSTIDEAKNLLEAIFIKSQNPPELSDYINNCINSHKLKALSAIELAKRAEQEQTTDLAEVIGQNKAKRGLEVAAAGYHHILMLGPPGCGKSMLAKRFKGLLPVLTMEKALETTKIHSVSGQLKKDLILDAPFRAPHHSASVTSLVGGGANAKPGEISLAHNGVLFLDELTEFPRHTIEQLRQVLEEKTITVSRIKNSYKYPADFTLIAACNPCPCGYLGDSEKTCVCTPVQISKYITKLSGPLLDRIDIHIELQRLSPDEISKLNKKHLINKSNDQLLARIEAARDFAHKFNPDTVLEPAAEKFLESAIHKLKLSARSFNKILKVSRTIANLDLSKAIKHEHLAEALQFRAVDFQKYGL